MINKKKSDVKILQGSITTEMKKNMIHSSVPTARQTWGLEKPVFSGWYMDKKQNSIFSHHNKIRQQQTFWSHNILQ